MCVRPLLLFENMNRAYYIYPHQGLGDQIICNAIVRNICTKFYDRRIIVFCSLRDIRSMQFMYRDIGNIELVAAPHDYFIHEMLDHRDEEDKVYIGHHHLAAGLAVGKAFDECFYEQVGMRFERRRTYFKVVRDIKAEQDLFKRLNVEPGKYIFLHDDPNRGLVINRNHIIDKSLPVILPTDVHTDVIFDYLTLLGSAREIHCIDSSFRLLVDYIFSERPGLFFHVRLLDGALKPGPNSSSQLSWTII